MPVNRSEIQALVSLMDGHYQKIRSIETLWGIMGVEGDFRPRIEYYHDAIRMLMSGEDDPTSKFDRLAPERLAYDVAMLRQIIAKPASAGRGKQNYSAADTLVPLGQAGGGVDHEPDRKQRQELSQFYKDYTVLFVAILAPKVEDNAQIRSEETENVLNDCASLKQALEQVATGSASMEEMVDVVQDLEHDELRKAMKTLLARGQLSKEDIAKAITKLSETRDKVVMEKKTLDQASMNFSMGQLAIYEEAKDTVKRLANQGLNIAGKFVDSTLARGQGGGRGK
jgi:hypothetical protein